MSRPGPFKTLLINWKKSIFIVPAFSFALHYTYDYVLTDNLMKSSCYKATGYGDERLRNPTALTRHITVILNPKAGKGKSKKLYEKWAEPLLHLAGIKVSLVETGSAQEALELMKIMSNCDGVAIVGGDGTVHEAINGLLQRPDRLKAARDIPIGIIPTGQNNSIARYINQSYISYRNRKEFVISSTVKLIDATTTKYDVIKITPIDEELKRKELPIYAMRDIKYGLYQDNIFKLSGIQLYQTYVKPIWSRLQRMFSSKYNLPQIDAISYTEPCEGCSRCFERHKLHDDAPLAKPEELSGNRKWWGIMAPVNRSAPKPSEEEKRELELSKRDNPECGTWLSVVKPLDVTDFRACMMGDKKVRLSLGRHREYSPSDVSETQDVKLRLKPELESESRIKLLGKEVDAQGGIGSSGVEKSDSGDDKPEQQRASNKETTSDKEEKPVQFLIDGQPVVARSVEISAIGEALTVFTGPHKEYIPPSMR